MVIITKKTLEFSIDGHESMNQSLSQRVTCCKHGSTYSWAVSATWAFQIFQQASQAMEMDSYWDWVNISCRMPPLPLPLVGSMPDSMGSMLIHGWNSVVRFHVEIMQIVELKTNQATDAALFIFDTEKNTKMIWTSTSQCTSTAAAAATIRCSIFDDVYYAYIYI